MDESEDNMQTEDIQSVDSLTVKIKPKKRSLVERELETNLTARVTSPATSEGSSTSRYGRARRLKTAAEIDTEKIMKPLKIDVSKQPQAYKMHASNSPVHKESPKRTISVGSSIEDQIENIYHENISLSRFGSEEKAKSQSPSKKFNKVYIRKDLIQKPDTDTVVLIKNMFSPNKSSSHLNNILERSSEKYSLNGHGKAWNGFPDTSSVVKTLDFDGKKKKKDVKEKVVTINEKITPVKEKLITLKDKVTPIKEKSTPQKDKITPIKEKITPNKEKLGPLKEKVASKNDLFTVEAACEYQVGDLAWARVGTYPFWPCIVTREPYSDMFVKKKLFGRVERSVVHVTFFGDNGRRGWIVDNMLRKYHGRAEFEACRDKFTPEAKKKDPRLYAAHFVSEKKLSLWNVSVEEAETLLKEPKRLRIDILYDMLEKSRASKTTPKREKGGKISRTDSDVSLSESLYDTLFSEDDGKTDDGGRSKRVRNKSLDVSEVVTACLDNMAAKSGIIQIQRQSHMDRWLQKAKSKTPEKIQPKLHLMVERERRKDKVKKKSRDGKKSHRTRKNESLGTDTNLLPYQNEHDYSSVNYENHNINDSSNKNTDSASGLDSTLDSSDIGVVVKIESLSSSMDDLSQDDIITTVVNDDIVMTDPENINKDHNDLIEKNRSDNETDKLQNNSEHNVDSDHLNVSEQINTTVESLPDDISDKMETNHENRLTDSHASENHQIVTNEETRRGKSDLTKDQPRRSKRKRQTMEALNNSIIEIKTKVTPEVNSKKDDKDSSDILPPIYNINDHSLENNNSDVKEEMETKNEICIDSISFTGNIHHIDHSHSDENKPLETKELPFAIINDKIENNNDHLNSVHSNENEQAITKESLPEYSDLTSNVPPRRSKRKRQTFEGLNSSVTENNAKEPKLDLTEPTIIDTTISDSAPTSNEILKDTLETTKDCDSTDKGVPDSKLVTDISQLNKTKTVELTSFNSSSKPVVVIEPLNLNGLETQLIIKGSQQLLQNKWLDSVKNVSAEEMQNNCINTISNDPKTAQLESSVLNDSNKSVNIKTDVVIDTQKQVTEVLTKDVEDVVLNQVDEKVGSIDSKIMEVDSYPAETKTSKDPAGSFETEMIDVSKESSVQNNEEVLNENNATNVVIGEETYIFDRTLSQDYDEIDTGECKEASSTTTASKDKEVEVPSVIKVRDDLLSREYTDLGKANATGRDKTKTKRTVRSKEKSNTKKPMTEPEFIKYLEIRQDALLDEQPDLTQDEIAQFLYQNWLYEEGNKSEIKISDDDAQSNLVKDHQETVLPPKQTKNKSKSENPPGLKNLDIRHMMHRGIPSDSSNIESEDKWSSKEEILPEDSIKSDIQTNDLKSTEELLNSKGNDLSTNKCGSISKPLNIANTSNVRESTSSIPSNCMFLDKEPVHDDTKTEVDDNKQSTGDVSSKMSDEQNEVSKQMTEENNAPCVFLDQSLTDARSSDNKPKKQKSPRLSLNRTRKPIVKLNKIDNNLQIHENKVKIVKTDPEKALAKSYDSKNAATKSMKEKQDAKKAMNEPDFIKYLEIRQDALLEEQPDLTQDEIVTYLYQNWLYEEGNKSDIKKIDDNEQSNLVKGVHQDPLPTKKIKLKRKPKVEKVLEIESIDIRELLFREQLKEPIEDVVNQFNVHNTCPTKHQDSESTAVTETVTEESNSCKENGDSVRVNGPGQNVDICTESKIDAEDTNTENLNDIGPESETITTLTDLANNLIENSSSDQKVLDVNMDKPSTKIESIDKNTTDIEDVKEPESYTDELKNHVKDTENCNEPVHSEMNGYMESEDISSNSNTNNVFDPETASIKSEDSGVSVTTRKGRKEKNYLKKSMEDPEFIKYLEARQDALIDEQPDLTQEEIVTYLYQTWFYEESQKSDEKKSEETEQSNLVKGLSTEPAPLPKKIKKKPKVDKEPKIDKEPKVEKEPKTDKPPLQKVLKNGDIRDMVQKPKRKATQSKPYYNEEDSDLEEEDLETFKIFDRDEINGDGDEIDEVELYFEQLTKPKPNVFKGYVRERVCEICDRAGNLVKCKSCHGTFHVDCVKKEAEVIEIAAPTRGRKKKKGRKPKGYDPLLDSGSQSDERSQDANNSEELNISIEDEAETHIVLDADNFETQWENKMKELQTENQDEYASDQEIQWEVEPGRCEIVDLKQKEKPIDYTDYKCNNCLKYETPVCFVCKSNKSPKALTEVRQKCQVAHCHRYYHLECLEYWPQTQFNSWEPSKTNKKVIEYIEALSCPRHVCHTCVSDDPRGCKTRFCGDKLARCVKCPATYHSYTRCLPAGTQILTGSQIICPRHYENRPGKVPCHVNTGWCFICALGGTLICCEYCPTSFHAECLNIKPPEGSYMCEDCETGRLPLYGEMVWVKLGHYRWWPGIVLHPTEIPDNILAVKHSPGEFVVRFFGQYDHYWVNRGRVFPFQEGDSGRISSQKSKIDAAFTTAMEHAQRACEILKKMEPNEEEDLDIASSLLPPHYVKLTRNKPVGGVARRDADHNSLTQCDCEPHLPDPCGPYSHCLNRMLLTECGPLCRAGDRCNNRAFERRLYPRLQAYRTPQRGWGLRTLEDIKQGQFVIEYVGELIDMEEFRRRMCRKHEIRDENFYFLTLDKERMIDAGPKGNLARFMNHCCEPNCETQKWTVLGDVRVGLFALRDIPANSEVTFNYNLECAGIEKKRCLCGAKRCSGYIGAKPKQLQDDQPKKTKPPAKRTYKKRKPVEDTTTKPKAPKIKIKPIKPRELTEIEKDLLIIKNATNGMSSDSEGSRVSVDDKNPKALKRKRVSFSTEDVVAKKAKIAESDVVETT